MDPADKIAPGDNQERLAIGGGSWLDEEGSMETGNMNEIEAGPGGLSGQDGRDEQEARGTRRQPRGAEGTWAGWGE